MWSVWCVALGIGLGVARPAGGDAPLAIGLRWAKGQTLTYRLVERDAMLYEAEAPAGADLPSEVRTAIFTLTVRDLAADGSADVDLRVRSLVPADSDQELAEARPPGGWLVVFGPTGVPREVRGLDFLVTDPPGPGELARARLEMAFPLVSLPAASVGTTWTHSSTRYERRAGNVKVDRTFRLDSLDSAADGPLARIKMRMDARRDAEGKIPKDLSDDELDWAVERLSGTGELVFDVALGQPRRSTSTVRTVFVNRPRRELIDGFPDYERTVLEVESTITLELVEATGPPPPVPAPVVTPPAVETLPKFEEFARQVQETCFVAPYDQTNTNLRSAAASEAECLRKRMVAELDRVLLPSKDSDPAAFRALMAEQALWNSYVEASCWLTEEAQWVDLDTRTRSDGTARGYAGIGCETEAALGRGYYARARRLGDARGFAGRIAAHGSPAEKVRTYVRRVRSTLAGKAKRPKNFPRDRPLVSGEIEELLRKARVIEYTAGQLARATCRGWPELAEALGGVEPCVKKAEPYYLAYGPSGS